MVNKMYLNYSLGSLGEIEGRGIPSPRSKKSENVGQAATLDLPVSCVVVDNLVSFREALEAI